MNTSNNVTQMQRNITKREKKKIYTNIMMEMIIIPYDISKYQRVYCLNIPHSTIFSIICTISSNFWGLFPTRKVLLMVRCIITQWSAGNIIEYNESDLIKWHNTKCSKQMDYYFCFHICWNTSHLYYLFNICRKIYEYNTNCKSLQTEG